MSQHEMMRLQGFLPAMWAWPQTASVVGHSLGNSIAGCVAQRLLVRILSHIGDAPAAADPWESRKAQIALLADATADVIA